MYYDCNFTLSISLINQVRRKERAKHATALVISIHIPSSFFSHKAKEKEQIYPICELNKSAQDLLSPFQIS